MKLAYAKQHAKTQFKNHMIGITSDLEVACLYLEWTIRNDKDHSRADRAIYSKITALITEMEKQKIRWAESDTTSSTSESDIDYDE